MLPFVWNVRSDPMLSAICVATNMLMMSTLVLVIHGQHVENRSSVESHAAISTADHDNVKPTYMATYAGRTSGESFYTAADRILRNIESPYHKQYERWRSIRSKREISTQTAAPNLNTQMERTNWTNKSAILDERQHALKQIPANHISIETNATSIDLSCSNINESSILSFGNVPQLQTLILAGNDLTDFTGSMFNGSAEQLRTLDMSGNRFITLGVRHFDRLVHIERIRMAHNQIAHIEEGTFDRLQSLQLLDLSHNHIDVQAVPALRSIPDLVALSVAFNPALGTALQEFVASWSLKELDASGTGLCNVPAALAQSVHTLNVSYNQFEIIRRGDVDSYPLLKYLDMSHNNITDIEDDAFGRLEILITLSLHDNRINNVPTNLPTSLVHLLLGGNRITDLLPATFSHLATLETLDLSRNRLTYVPGLPLPRLQLLNLRNSGLRGLSQSVVKMSPRLRELQLDGNPIKCPTLQGLAEWTRMCRRDAVDTNNRLDGNVDGFGPVVWTTPRYEGLLAADATPVTSCWDRQTRYNKHALDASVCKRDRLEVANAAQSVKPIKKTRKAKMEDIWRALSSETTKIPTPLTTNLSNHTEPFRYTNEHNSVSSAPENPKSIGKNTSADSDIAKSWQAQTLQTEQITNVLNDKSRMLSPAQVMYPRNPNQTRANDKAKHYRSKIPSTVDMTAHQANRSQINSDSLSTVSVPTSAPHPTSRHNRNASRNDVASNTKNALPPQTTTITTTAPFASMIRHSDEKHETADQHELIVSKLKPIDTIDNVDIRNNIVGNQLNSKPILVGPHQVLHINSQRSPNNEANNLESITGVTATRPQTTLEPIMPMMMLPTATASQQRRQQQPVRVVQQSRIVEHGSSVFTAKIAMLNLIHSQSATAKTKIPMGGRSHDDNKTDAMRTSADSTSPIPYVKSYAHTQRHQAPNTAAVIIENITMTTSAEPASENNPTKANERPDAINIYVAEQSLVAVEMAQNRKRVSAPSATAIEDGQPVPLAVVVHSGHPPLNNAGHTSQPLQDRRPSPEHRGTRHAGVLAVAFVTIGVIVALLGVQLYRCTRTRQQKRSRQLAHQTHRQRFGRLVSGTTETAVDDQHSHGVGDDTDSYAGGHRDMMPMELLANGGSMKRYSETPVERW